ncbi:PcfJ domain-containing protein [Rhizobium sp. BK176]|uniref:PcfJ domain-containing protein n=1 Tax=Rhizobium sp. BK176 TaxID=2587071 RepID=UPI002166F710|nr:PcfJ domain-containing protein [Rhizobium sp. BK176]MCS4089726.1 hypothetical protein [Rhizobium sp. BK176]
MTTSGQKAEIAAFVEQMTDNERVRLLLTYCVGRLMLRNARQHKPIHDGIGSLLDVMHVTDWLSAAVVNEAAWLANTDDQGRPKKLLKFSSFEQIMQEANKAMLIEARKAGVMEIAEGDEELVMTLADGYYVVRLLTPAALDKESGQMQHCIGAGAYDNALAKGSAEFFSLRDAAGNAHATMEVSAGEREIVQLQGKQNKNPEDRYIRILLPMMKAKRLGIDRVYLGKTRFIDEEYNFVDLRNLESGAVIHRHVYIENEGIIAFPEKLEIRGNFTIRNSDNVRMPSRLTVSGNLDLERTDGVTKCDDLKVGGTLRVSNCTWDEIAISLEAGSVAINDCSVSKLADTLVVHRDLTLTECAIRDLGNLDCVESLSLSLVPWLELKNPIKVSGLLSLRGYEQERLPEIIYGYSSLSIQEAAITELPEGMVLKELDVSFTPLKALPADLEVSARLTAWGCTFPEIPGTAKLGGSLDISRSKCRSLPDGLTLDSLFVSDCDELEALPSDLTVRQLRAKSSSVRHIGSRLVVKQDAVFDRSEIVAIPSDAEFHRDVCARQCGALREVGRAFFGGFLKLSGSGPLVLANGLDVGGHLVLGDVDRLPHGLCVGGHLYTEIDVHGIEHAVIGGQHIRSALSVAQAKAKNSAPGIG